MTKTETRRHGCTLVGIAADSLEPNPKVCIVGLQRSGTTHAEAWLRSHLRTDAIDQHFWKHSLPSEVRSWAAHPDTSTILITRHPARWLQSCLRHHPADIRSTRSDIVRHTADIRGYAALYNLFLSEWIDALRDRGGLILSHTSLLDGSAADRVGRLTGGRHCLRPETSKIGKVDFSIEYGDGDSLRRGLRGSFVACRRRPTDSLSIDKARV